jgi:hypothetical protein
MKGLAWRGTHVKYESPTTYQSKVMTKDKVLKKVKSQGQRLEGQGYGIKWKVLPEEIYMWNMKAWPSLSKVMTMIKVLEKVNFKVKDQMVKVKISNERSCQNGIHMWDMETLLPTNQKIWPRLKFSKRRSKSKVKGQRVKVLVSNERSCQKEYTCEI